MNQRLRWSCWLAPLYASLLALSFLDAKEVEPPPPASNVEKPLPGTPIAKPKQDGYAGILRWIGLSAEDTINPGDDGKHAGLDGLEFEWKQTAGPSVNFTANQTILPKIWLLIHEPGDYTFELRARNAKGWGAPAGLKFKVSPVRPLLALENALALTGAGERIDLPGQAWKQLTGPKVDLSEAKDGSVTTFRPLLEGLYLFEAMHAGEHPERHGILIPPGKDEEMGDRRPVAGILQAYMGVVDQKVIIDAGEAGSRDPDGDPLQAMWWSPESDRLRIVQHKGLKVSITASKAGQYHIHMLVTDGKLDSLPRETVLHIFPAGGQSEEEVAGLAPPQKDPLCKPITLGLYGKTLDDAVQKFPTAFGMTVRVDPEWLKPKELGTVDLNLGVKNGAQRILLDYLCRQGDCAYRLQRGGLTGLTTVATGSDNSGGELSIWLTKPNFFDATEGMKTAWPPVDALYENADGSDLQAMLSYCLEGALKSRQGASLEVQPAQQRVVAVLPESGIRRVQEIVGSLRAPKLLGLPTATPRTLAQARMRRRLGSETISLDWMRRPPSLDMALLEFSEKSGLPVGWDPRQFPNGYPKVKLKLDGVPLREAIREIVAVTGLSGCQVQAVDSGQAPDAGIPLSATLGGLWFYKGGEPFPSSERLWDTAYVRCYDIQPLLAKYGELLSGELLVHEIQHRIFPDSWNDTGARVSFNPPTGKLIIIHAETGQNRVMEFLNDLDLRGEAALGPAVTTPAPK